MMPSDWPEDPPMPSDQGALSSHEQLIAFLEADQLSSERVRPLPRATLGRGAVVTLWALRVFVTIVGAMVIYTFIAQVA
jgi:hypothetical protein